MQAQYYNNFSIVMGADRKILEAQEEVLAFLGIEMSGDFNRAVYAQDLAQVAETMAAVQTSGRGFTCFRLQEKTGKLHWVSAHITKADGAEDGTVRMEIKDIESLEDDSSDTDRDQMTGLLNKQAIIRRAHMLAAKRPYEKFILCVMDIDNFKSVNDVYGHMRGDEVIIDVAHIARDCIGKQGSVGRIGGDEFMILLEHADDEQSARSYLKEIRLAVEALYAEDGDGVHVTVTIGAVLFPDHAHNYDEMFMVADKMLYIGKMKGRNRYIIYTPELHGNVLTENKVSDSGFYKAMRNKTKLMMQLFDRALHGERIPVNEVMQDVVCHYNLDGMYLFYDDSDTSVCGMAHRDGVENMAEYSEMSMAALHAENIGRLFNENRVALIDFRELKRYLCEGIYDYIEGKEIRYMIIYRMEREKDPGHIVYINRRDNSRKFADSDVTDLTYISKILEVISEKELPRN